MYRSSQEDTPRGSILSKISLDGIFFGSISVCLWIRWYRRSNFPQLSLIMTKPFLILLFRPENDASDGEFESVLRFGGLLESETERVRMERGEMPRLPLERYCGIWAGGGPANVSDPKEKKSESERVAEKNLRLILAEAIERDIPFLGVCYGLGVLASALGGAVSKNSFAEQAGATDIEITEDGLRDPLLVGLPRSFRSFVGHKEACERVPDGAALLATSKCCLVQMIRVKRNIYATQFHPELDPSGIVVRINAYKHHGYFAPEEAEALREACLREAVTVPMEILRRFVAMARKSSES